MLQMVDVEDSLQRDVLKVQAIRLVVIGGYGLLRAGSVSIRIYY